MDEPRLPSHLEVIEEQQPVPAHEYYPECLRELARQLGVRNDFYYQLCGAATLLEQLNIELLEAKSRLAALEK